MIIGGRDYSNALQIAVEHIKKEEAFRANAYPDAGYKWDAPTIGYGTARYYRSTGEPIRRGDTITEEDATNELLLTVVPAIELIHNEVKADLTNKQVAALASFIYNVGPKNFRTSTLLERLNEGDFEGASKEFPRWVYSNGTRLAGLEKRRQSDRAMFDDTDPFDGMPADAVAIGEGAPAGLMVSGEDETSFMGAVKRGVSAVTESARSLFAGGEQLDDVPAGAPAELPTEDVAPETMPDNELPPDIKVTPKLVGRGGKLIDVTPEMLDQERPLKYAEKYKLMDWPGLTAPIQKQMQFIRQRLRAWEHDSNMKDTQD